ncbi:MAG: hypothetical protein C7B46_03465 [Sulfobacillus benefaciens]|uniref:Uncharacterized protein n=1 Tax=Sulfobacillus benefaciens TaxID=453960 RepID=A0A2T2XJX1_9FIRM|nr:MAG: hypothetical protein C7B46_03465 [Sulfobacillus benefaciens]
MLKILSLVSNLVMQPGDVDLGLSPGYWNLFLFQESRLCNRANFFSYLGKYWGLSILVPLKTAAKASSFTSMPT